jgi:hypothetical protein
MPCQPQDRSLFRPPHPSRSESSEYRQERVPAGANQSLVTIHTQAAPAAAAGRVALQPVPAGCLLPPLQSPGSEDEDLCTRAGSSSKVAPAGCRTPASQAPVARAAVLGAGTTAAAVNSSCCCPNTACPIRWWRSLAVDLRCAG